MIESRQGDARPINKFRCDRFFQAEGGWYFHTREGTVEGPYVSRHKAEQQVDSYIRVVNSGFHAPKAKLALEPL